MKCIVLQCTFMLFRPCEKMILLSSLELLIEWFFHWRTQPSSIVCIHPVSVGISGVITIWEGMILHVRPFSPFLVYIPPLISSHLLVTHFRSTCLHISVPFEVSIKYTTIVTNNLWYWPITRQMFKVKPWCSIHFDKQCCWSSGFQLQLLVIFGAIGLFFILLVVLEITRSIERGAYRVIRVKV